MKKLFILGIILISAQALSAQAVTLSRYAAANKDTLRTQIRMSVIDVATDRVDTATNGSLRLCNAVLREPTAGYWIDYFAYQMVSILPSFTPTDLQVRNTVISLWGRVARINTTR